MKNVFKLLVTAIITVSVIIACAQAPSTPTVVEKPTEEPIVETATEVEETEPPLAETATEMPAEEETEVTEPVDEIRLLIVERCEGCHSADRVFREDYTAEEWEAVFERMIGYGANVSEEEQAQMIDWLVSNNN